MASAVFAPVRGWGAIRSDPGSRTTWESFRAAHREFEDRARLPGEGRGATTGAIQEFIPGPISPDFTVAEVRAAALGASDSRISKVFACLLREGVIASLGTGRAARWRRRD